MDIRIKKADQTISVDETKLPAHVRDHIFEYGLRQKLNDSISGLSRDGTASTTKATSAEMVDSVNETLERLYAGDLRATRTVDSVGRTAYQLAVKKVCNVWLAKHRGEKLEKYESKGEDARAYLAAHPELNAVAEQMVALTSADVEV
jgi:hypothetical protein